MLQTLSTRLLIFGKFKAFLFCCIQGSDFSMLLLPVVPLIFSPINGANAVMHKYFSLKMPMECFLYGRVKLNG